MERNQSERILMSLFIKKDLDRMLADANDPGIAEGGGKSAGLKRHLNAFNLTALGVGAIIGAGIFSLTGLAAANYAGPAIVYSFIIGGILCAFAGLCYSEMAAMVPVAGSAYAYSYATMGEFIAWIIGWDLILEYAFGAVTVSAAWSGYFVSLMTKTLGIEFGDTLMRFTKGPWETVPLFDGSIVHGIWNLPATLIALIMSAVLFRGIKESAKANNIIVFVKVFIILAFIVVGWGVIDTANWIANPEANGLAKLVPPPEMVTRHGQEYMAFGWPGVLTGAGVVFFAYIGFDAISTTAQEAKNPQRDLPIGILASLIGCTLVYVLMSLTMTGVVPFRELAVPDPVAFGVDRIVELRQWSPAAGKALAFFVKFGALAGLTSVILVMMLGQTRVFYAMAKDGLLPWFDKVHPKHQTPGSATIITGVFVAVVGGLMPMSLVGELVSIGTLLAFMLVCIGVPILRITDPNRHRPFKTPAYWFVSIAGAASCLWVMSGLPHDTWFRLLAWLAVGFVIYFAYSYKNSKLRKSLQSK
jgi:APA family basic amino acid/polyamine antiporter